MATRTADAPAPETIDDDTDSTPETIDDDTDSTPSHIAALGAAIAAGLRAGGATDEIQPADSGEYVVLASVINVKIGKAKNAVARYRRGQIVRFRTMHTDIDKLLRLGAVAVNDGEPKRALSVAALAKNAGADDDPVRTARSEVFTASEPMPTPTEVAAAEAAATPDAEPTPPELTP